MKKSRNYIIFLNNEYSVRDNRFYLRLLPGKVSIAADGGIRFFRRNKLRPDIMIGDFDSSPKLSKKYLESMEVIKYPVHKDKTDSQLAVELALERGATGIEICGALSADEIDHSLGNIFLLDIIGKFRKKHRQDIPAIIKDSKKDILLLENESIKLSGKPGDAISIIPLIDNCRVNFKGLLYPPPSGKLVFGDSLTLRNQFLGKTARITAKGKILLIVYSKHL